MVPSLDFGQVSDNYFVQRGRVVHLYGTSTGSNLHAIRALENPRWEDYEYERLDDTPNRLFWLGDGQTANERNMSGDRKCRNHLHMLVQLLNPNAVVWYLDDVDVPPIPQ